MKEINIDIRKAKIKSCQIEFKDDEPKVYITIGLYTNSGKEISTFVVSNSGRSGIDFELEPNLIILIKDLLNQFESIAVRQCSASIGELGEFNF